MSNIEVQDIERVVEDRFAVYGATTVKSRALPSIEDGLNPVSRKVLWTFITEGYSLKFRKAAYFVGNCLANSHPHGDMSLYSTMIGLSQSFNKLNPLIDPQGNNGSLADTKSFAAQRYVELRMSSFANHIFGQDMSKDYIPMKENYDGSSLEPVLLPSLFPTILNTGMQGIASGFASGLPPHKVDDICDLTIRYIKSIKANKELSDKDLIKDFRPDFPAGGIITNESQLYDIYTSGNGVINIDALIEEGVYHGKPALIVKELPYKVDTSNVLMKIQDLMKDVKGDGNAKVAGILADKLADVKDLSSKTQPVELVLIPKKDVSLGVLKNILLTNTSLRDTFTYLSNVLVGDKLIEKASLRDILGAWLNFRVTTLNRKYNHAISKAQYQRVLRVALKKAHANIDKVLDLMKKASSKEDAIEKLQKLLKISHMAATYIASIQLYQISKLEVSKVDNEIKELDKEIEKLMDYLANVDTLYDLILEELEGIKKKYASKRKTTLTNTYMKGTEIDIRDSIESEDLVIGISTDNYVYAKPTSEMREYVQRGAKGANFIDAKYKRVIRDIMVVNSHDDLFVFTDQGKVIEAKGYQFNLWHKGISNAIPDLGDQLVVSVVKAHVEDDKDKFFTFVTKNSMMKHVTVENMTAKQKRSGGNIAITIEEGDELVSVQLTENENARIVITSNLGRAQNLAATDIAVALRPTRGYPKATLAEGEFIKCMTIIPEDRLEGALLLVAASNGIGKVTPLADLPARRGDSGKRSLMRIITFKAEGAELVCGLLVNPDDSIVTTTKANKTSKIAVSLVNQSGRNAKGVKLATLDGNDSVIGVSVV